MNGGLLVAALLMSETSPAPALCVCPGDSVAVVQKQCRIVSEGVDYTEEGPLPHLKVAYGRDVVTLDIYDGKVDLVRFRTGPLAYPGVEVGNDLGSVRNAHPYLELHSMQGEEGYLVSLVDSKRCMNLIFDAGEISDPDFEKERFSDLKLVGINWTSAEGCGQ